MRLEQLFFRQADLSPQRWAVQEEDVRLTYKELSDRVRERIDQLAGMGAVAGDLFALKMPNGIAWIRDVLAVAGLGGIIVPFHHEWTEEEKTAIMHTVRPEWMLDPEPHYLLRTEARSERRLPLRAATDFRDLFLLGMTSGSTGSPKGFVKSHRSWMVAIDGWSRAFRLSPQDRVIVPLSMSYSAQLFPAVHALCTGAEAVLLARYSPGRLLAVQGTCVNVTPAVLDSILNYIEKRKSDRLDVPRTVISVGAKLTPAKRRRFERSCPESALYEYYGSSEMGYVALLTPENAIKAPESIGSPFPGVEVEFFDHAGNPIAAAAARPGKLYVRSEQSFEGYIGNPQLTESSFLGEWATSHDLGYLRHDGNIQLMGRDRDIVKAGGSLVYTAEVEEVLTGMDGVEEAAVMAFPDPSRGEIVWACLVLEEGMQLTVVKQECARRLAPYKRPRKWTLLSALPKNRNGKTDKAQLANQWGPSPSF